MKANLIISLVSAHSSGNEAQFEKALSDLIHDEEKKGNSSLAQLVVFMPPIIAIIVSYALTHQIYAINIGTVFALLFQGGLVGVFDKIVFPDLKHRNLE